MAKQLELYDTFPISVAVDGNKKEVIMSDAEGVKDDYSLIVEVDATHSGTLINNRVYPPDSMKKGVKSWTKPYKKPVLTNHDDSQDPIGRVIKAKYIPTDRGMGKEYKPVLKPSDGFGFQRLTVRITDPDSIAKIIDGRYDTVSVRMTTDHAFCSICNADWSVDGPCEHWPGETADGKLCYLTTGDLSYREVSFVNIPADEFAGVKDINVVKDNKDEEPSGLTLFASNESEKILSGLNSEDGTNLFGLLDSDVEEEDELVLHLLDQSSKVEKSQKEEDVKLEELTKEQLQDHEVVKAMIAEAVAARDSELEAELTKLKDELEKKDSASDEEQKEEEAAEAEVKEEEAPAEETTEEAPAEEAVEEKAEEEAEEEKEETPAEEGKDEATEETSTDLDADKTRLQDENARIGAELHKVIAEKLYDLKVSLGKPDVADVTTPDERDEKISDLAKRSIDSLKDQIADLLLEKDNSNTTKPLDEKVESPAAVRPDSTNDVEDKAEEKKPENKKQALKRLFS